MPDRRPEIHALQQLWTEQQRHMAARGDQSEAWYLAAHYSLALTIRRRLVNADTATRYARGRVLEWGCHHAPDSCILRIRLGQNVELHGADIMESDAFRPFHEYSGLTYARLEHPSRLDYPDEYFDVVTSTGVLEHVPDEAASLREIHRVLRPNGHFVVTFLPNRYSWSEAAQRRRGGPAHDRLYGLNEVTRLLESHGFDVVERARRFVLPLMLTGMPPALRRLYERAGPVIWALNAALERCWPMNRMANSLSLVARKSRDQEA